MPERRALRSLASVAAVTCLAVALFLIVLPFPYSFPIAIAAGVVMAVACILCVFDYNEKYTDGDANPDDAKERRRHGGHFVMNASRAGWPALGVLAFAALFWLP